MANRGRPVLKHKSKACYVRVPYEINLKLMEYVDRSQKSISEVFLEALKEYLGIWQTLKEDP